MLTVTNNKITLTKGDTLTLALTLTKDGQTYTPESTDSIRFALSNSFVGKNDYELILTKDIPYNSLSLTLAATETDALEYKTYNYDVQITHGDGTVDTVILSTLTITKEVE